MWKGSSIRPRGSHGRSSAIMMGHCCSPDSTLRTGQTRESAIWIWWNGSLPHVWTCRINGLRRLLHIAPINIGSRTEMRSIIETTIMDMRLSHCFRDRSSRYLILSRMSSSVIIFAVSIGEMFSVKPLRQYVRSPKIRVPILTMPAPISTAIL